MMERPRFRNFPIRILSLMPTTMVPMQSQERRHFVHPHHHHPIMMRLRRRRRRRIGIRIRTVPMKMTMTMQHVNDNDNDNDNYDDEREVEEENEDEEEERRTPTFGASSRQYVSEPSKDVVAAAARTGSHTPTTAATAHLSSSSSNR